MIHHALKPAVLSWFRANPGKHSFNRIWEALEHPPREHLRDTLRSFRKSQRLIQHGSREWEMKTTAEPNGKISRGTLLDAFLKHKGAATRAQLRKTLHGDPIVLLQELEQEGVIEGVIGGLYRLTVPGVKTGTTPAKSPEAPAPAPKAPKARGFGPGEWRTDPWTVNPYAPDSNFGQIVEALRLARPGTLTLDGIVQLTGGKRQSTQAALTVMASDWYARRVGHGLWSATVPSDPIREGTTRSRVLCATTSGEDITLGELSARLGGDLEPSLLWKMHFSPGLLADKLEGRSGRGHPCSRLPEFSGFGDTRDSCPPADRRFHRKSAEDIRAEQLAREAPRQEERKAIAAAPMPVLPPSPKVEHKAVEISQLAKMEPPKLPVDPLATIVADLRTQFTERERAAGELAHALSGLLQDLHRLDGAIRAMDPTQPPFSVTWGPGLVMAVEEALKPRPMPWQGPPQQWAPPYGPPPPPTKK